MITIRLPTVCSFLERGEKLDEKEWDETTERVRLATICDKTLKHYVLDGMLLEK